MKYSLFKAICFVGLSLLSSCSSKDDTTIVVDQKDSTTLGIWNDYFPLNVGTKYKYKYLDSFMGPSEVSKVKVGECTWDFVSASTDIPVVYVVKQSFTGLCITGSSKKDTLKIENEISTLSFKIATDNKVTFTFIIPYYPNRSWTFERYVQSESATLCYYVGSFDYNLCLKKNLGISSIRCYIQGNHTSSVQYDLIEGPYY